MRDVRTQRPAGGRALRRSYAAASLAAVIGLASGIPALPSSAATTSSVHDIGTSAFDFASGNAIDGQGNQYVAGVTGGRIPGASELNAGLNDGYLAKYSSAGAQLWVHEFGTAGADSAYVVSLDAQGNAYVAGKTSGALPGSSDAFAGGTDAFVAKYSSTGTRQWVHQLGSAVDDAATAIALDPNGNIYLYGFTDGALPTAPEADTNASAAFIAKYSSSGTRSWVHQLQSPNPNGTAPRGTFGYWGVVDSAGNSYLTGSTDGKIPGAPETASGSFDTFVAKYDTNGTKLWVHVLGGANSEGTSDAIDASGNLYVTGYTSGKFAAAPETIVGGTDAFLARLDTNGNLVWMHQYGSTADDIGFSVGLDSAGRPHIAGETFGTMPRSTTANAGDGDAFVMRVTTGGAPVWTRQLGSPLGDFATQVTIDPSGNALVVGTNDGTLPGAPEPYAGASDAFLWKVVVPARTVSVAWSANESTRLNQMATSLGTTPAGVQKTSVYVISFLLGFAPSTPQPQTLPPHTGNAVTYVDTWQPDEFDVLDRVEAKFALNDVDATRFSVAVIDYLLALGGH